MSKTVVSIKGESFYINDKLTYAEVENSNPDTQGLLMNARFIQGIFDDNNNRERYARFGRDSFDPVQNTDELIKALPEWYNYGLRAFTVGFQGGGPCFTINNKDINNNPFSEDGKSLDPHYKDRMDRLIKAADELGMVVIVSYFYFGQTHRLGGNQSIRNAVKTASNFLRDGGYTNVIIEIANEQDICTDQSILSEGVGIVSLMELAQEESGGMPVGCSGTGGHIDEDIVKNSDVILIHGNGCSRQEYYKMIKQVKDWAPDKPVVCNEDSQAIGQLKVAYNTYSSWGYYNNMTKQEPPTDWSITEGEDKFFAWRMASGLGIEVPGMTAENQFYLQGFEPEMIDNGERWIRVASLYPEEIDYVDFYLDGEKIFTCYDEPFSLYFDSNWRQHGLEIKPEYEEFKAEIHLCNGEIVEKINQF